MEQKTNNCPFEGFVREDALIPDREAQLAAEERAADIFVRFMMSITEDLIGGLSEEQLSVRSKSRLSRDTSFI
ncbi:MAG: hypothetical protein BHV69_10170 [Bacteroidales bacterium 52_46]|nr:MAG: hypothetical protein BHV69_10170 [Bacteroidales bacterium 52_46]